MIINIYYLLMTFRKYIMFCNVIRNIINKLLKMIMKKQYIKLLNNLHNILIVIY